MTDTIFAPATAPGRAAVAILRLSGPEARSAVATLTRDVPEPRKMALRTLRSAAGDALDRAVVLWLPGPGSYTGEDSAEFHVHGGPAVVDAVSKALAAAGARPAEPGEFTRRSFENGRMDLAQAEAVADLVEAETEAQRRQALDQLGGALGRRHEDWRALITRAQAVLEAAIDFPDEDLPAEVARAAEPVLRQLQAEIIAALSESDRGERVREGFRIGILGAPNAGKSSLLNAIVRREAAIVTARPGTTRDIIEIPLVIAGYKVLLADTAGLRDTDDEIEAEGVRRARAWAEAADLRLWVVDGSAAIHVENGLDLLRPGDLALVNKVDLPPGSARSEVEALVLRRQLTGPVVLSATTGEGVEQLHDALQAAVVQALGGANFPAGTRLRHRDRLQEAAARLTSALAILQEAPELAAEDLRLAGRALEQVTGRIDADSVLGEVFGTFCIGK